MSDWRFRVAGVFAVWAVLSIIWMFNPDVIFALGAGTTFSADYIRAVGVGLTVISGIAAGVLPFVVGNSLTLELERERSRRDAHKRAARAVTRYYRALDRMQAGHRPGTFFSEANDLMKEIEESDLLILDETVEEEWRSVWQEGLRIGEAAEQVEEANLGEFWRAEVRAFGNLVESFRSATRDAIAGKTVVRYR